MQGGALVRVKSLEGHVIDRSWYLFPLMLALSITIAGAQSIPRIDFERSCREAARLPGYMTTFSQCVADEGRARDELANIWSSFAPSEQRECTALTGIGGSPTYAELVECLIMTRDERTIRTKH